MNSPKPIDRRRFLSSAVQAASLLALAGCDNLSRSDWFPSLLSNTEKLTKKAQRALSPRKAMAREYTEADRSAVFPANGNSSPEDVNYQAMAKNGFADWKLEIGGLVQKPASFSLTELRQMPSRAQTTRHDCVEGWSAIAQWKGVKLGDLLERVQPKPEAHFIVFHCADPDEDGQNYYESIDFDDAYHPQTILAYEMNDRTLPIAHGAPIRLRVERQLGYKQAKYIMRIELVEGFTSIAGGRGGYWEDQGYEWYAGI
ncbi:MAG: molybdopterin-binding protein [Candidatus Sericytochromatia bacterium]|uniref:Molybdopterin-binding protein n=1 Tax=Candidatus Tanganyikabacteria bacterium TaxID=2961651 RepID=A0A937X7B3_9BACT|nr:molybdopterin-binding protein [Candidatus Tanganyikabacteria bacterium]